MWCWFIYIIVRADDQYDDMDILPSWSSFHKSCSKFCGGYILFPSFSSKILLGRANSFSIWTQKFEENLFVLTWRSSAPEAEFITKNLTRKKFKFGSGLHIPAKNFKEIIKIKSDHHNILNNFCEIKFNSEECPSHHIIGIIQPF